MLKTTLSITGMACPKCEAHVNEAIKAHFSVRKVTSSHEKNETVVLSDAPLDKERLAAVIEEKGYTLTNISEEEKKKILGLF